MTSLIKKWILGLWCVLFAALVVSHLLVSLHLAELHSSGMPAAKPVQVGPSDFSTPAAKWLVGVLIVFLILFIWPKSRRFGTAMFLYGILFGLLAFGWYQTVTAYLATDLQEYSERFTGASVALLVCLFWFVSVLFMLFAKSRVAKRREPPII